MLFVLKAKKTAFSVKPETCSWCVAVAMVVTTNHSKFYVFCCKLTAIYSVFGCENFTASLIVILVGLRIVQNTIVRYKMSKMG